MKIIDPTFEYIAAPTREEAYRAIAAAMRNCYRAELNAMPATDEQMVEKAIKRGHLSVLEFAEVSINITCDRGVTHELVRHRLCSYAQESTRYCNYSGEKFGRELTFVRPSWTLNPGMENRMLLWMKAVSNAEDSYMEMLDAGATPQEARAVLPNSLATKVAMKANMREWIHVFRMRCDLPAHPDMRQTMTPLLIEMKAEYPEVFTPVYEWLKGKGAVK